MSCKKVNGVLNIYGAECEYDLECDGFGLKWVHLTKNGIRQLKSGPSPYHRNLNRASSHTPEEKANLNAGKGGCVGGKAPKEAEDAFKRAKADCKSLYPSANLGGDCQCMTNLETYRRVTGQNTTTLEDCEAWKESNGSLRSCESIHAVGRAQDILNSITDGITSTYLYPDYRDPTTKNSILYKCWSWFVENAHKYQLCGISNEWWHWQYLGQVQSVEGAPATQSDTGNTSGSGSTDGGQPVRPETTVAQDIQAMIQAIFGGGSIDTPADGTTKPVESKETKTEKNPDIKSVSEPTGNLDKVGIDRTKKDGS